MPLRRSALWAVTCYFNPAGYQRKLENFRTFRDRLTVPLIAVEQGFDGRFELGPGDADVVLRVRDGDVLWQKERLLNLGIKALPRACEAVAWLDCDIIFDEAGWAEESLRALERLELVHLFHERHNLPRDESLDRLADWTRRATSLSAVHKVTTGRASLGDLIQNNAQLDLGSTAGLAWACRRAVLDAHGLYDACILGGADRVMMCAGLGELAAGAQANHMNSRRMAHYLAWARPFFESVRGRVGAIPGRVFHLWHGDLRDRRYEERIDLLDDLDPYTDVVADAGGCWRWNSDKPDLHAAVRRYFEARNEDGLPAEECLASLAGAREA